jgi:glycosyltransferase involved in cell wall biosynthesis
LEQRILIITTHPIQYHAPLFAYLTKNSIYQLKVLYTSGKGAGELYDAEFGKMRSWNIDMLNGYDYEILQNNSKYKEGNHFFSIRNPELLQEISNYNPSLLVIFGWNHSSHLKVMRHFKGKIPIVFRGDSTALDDQDGSFFKRFLRYIFLRWVYCYTDFVFSPGTASDKYFLNAGLDPKQIIRAAHAIDNDWFSSFSSEESERLDNLKKKYQVSDSETIFLFAGKFTSKKNPMLLINAFSGLVSSNPGARLFLVGDGPLEAEIKSRYNALSDDVARRITILPFQDQPSMKLIYRVANIFVLPSQGPGETWGLSVNEALACGTPVMVSSRCGCAADLVKDGINGYVFASGDISSLQHKMAICCDKKVSGMLSANANSSIEGFDFHAFNSSLDQLMNSFG